MPESEQSNGQQTAEERLNQVVFEALGAASTCWVGGTGDAVFDSEQAEKIGTELIRNILHVVPTVRREPFLGYATTYHLIQELEVRARISQINNETWPNYRTVDPS